MACSSLVLAYFILFLKKYVLFYVHISFLGKHAILLHSLQSKQSWVENFYLPFSLFSYKGLLCTLYFLFSLKILLLSFCKLPMLVLSLALSYIHSISIIYWIKVEISFETKKENVQNRGIQYSSNRLKKENYKTSRH